MTRYGSIKKYILFATYLGIHNTFYLHIGNMGNRIKTKNKNTLKATLIFINFKVKLDMDTLHCFNTLFAWTISVWQGEHFSIFDNY